MNVDLDAEIIRAEIKWVQEAIKTKDLARAIHLLERLKVDFDYFRGKAK